MFFDVHIHKCLAIRYKFQGIFQNFSISVLGSGFRLKHQRLIQPASVLVGVFLIMYNFRCFWSFHQRANSVFGHRKTPTFILKTPNVKIFLKLQLLCIRVYTKNRAETWWSPGSNQACSPLLFHISLLVCSHILYFMSHRCLFSALSIDCNPLLMHHHRKKTPKTKLNTFANVGFVPGILFITSGRTYLSECLSPRCVGEDILPNALEWTEQTTEGEGGDTPYTRRRGLSPE